MAVTGDLQIDEGDGRVRVHGLEIRDDDVVAYLTDTPKEDRTDALETALRVGVLTLQLSETSREAEFVKHGFDEMRSEIEREL